MFKFNGSLLDCIAKLTVCKMNELLFKRFVFVIDSKKKSPLAN